MVCMHRIGLLIMTSEFVLMLEDSLREGGWEA